MTAALIRQILRRFPAETHALLLVHDPDNLLGGEAVWDELARRGFRLIAQDDSMELRYAYEQAQPITRAQPLLIVTADPLHRMPYDIWQQAYRVELALHAFFPNLDYPTVRLLNGEQRLRLGEAVVRRPVARPMSVNETRAYLLEQVFNLDETVLAAPAAALTWLARHHSRHDPLPAPLVDYAVTRLAPPALLAALPLATLLTDAGFYREFIQSAWQDYVETSLREETVPYVAGPVDFAADAALQDALPNLLRLGVVTPITVAKTETLPPWTGPGVVYDAAAGRRTVLNEALTAIDDALAGGDLRWADWQEIAVRWAQVVRLDVARTMNDDALHSRWQRTTQALDGAFAGWLMSAYSALANQQLPVPHHLYHVNSFLAAGRTETDRRALIILDGMSLAAWQAIRPVWQERRRDWRMEEQLLLAQIPSITAISRQALVSGLRPMRFGATLTTNRTEGAAWFQWWQGAGVAPRSIDYALLPNRRNQPYPASSDNPRSQALCYVSPVIDDMVHGATQGIGDVHSSLRLWLEGSDRDDCTASAWLEGLIQRLLEDGYRVAVTSDHGHVEALGMGQPQEGVTVETRSRRARIYDNEQFARAVQADYPDTILWHDDGLLPESRWALLPAGRQAFAPPGARVVSHGGLTLEEMIVPLITLKLEPAV